LLKKARRDFNIPARFRVQRSKVQRLENCRKRSDGIGHSPVRRPEPI